MIAPETAAHAAGTSALLPMLALGIPGSPTAAVLLGGLLIWGLQPGPLLFVEQKDFVWGLIASMYLGNLAGLIIVLTCVPLFAAILRIPFSIIAPVIIVICAIGAYTVHNAMLDIWFMLLFGVIGYVFKKLDYPLAPLVLALVLGDRIHADRGQRKTQHHRGQGFERRTLAHADEAAERQQIDREELGRAELQCELRDQGCQKSDHHHRHQRADERRRERGGQRLAGTPLLRHRIAVERRRDRPRLAGYIE